MVRFLLEIRIYHKEVGVGGRKLKNCLVESFTELELHLSLRTQWHSYASDVIAILVTVFMSSL